MKEFFCMCKRMSGCFCVHDPFFLFSIHRDKPQNSSLQHDLYPALTLQDIDWLFPSMNKSVYHLFCINAYSMESSCAQGEHLPLTSVCVALTQVDSTQLFKSFDSKNTSTTWSICYYRKKFIDLRKTERIIREVNLLHKGTQILFMAPVSFFFVTFYNAYGTV